MYYYIWQTLPFFCTVTIAKDRFDSVNRRLWTQSTDQQTFCLFFHMLIKVKVVSGDENLFNQFFDKGADCHKLVFLLIHLVFECLLLCMYVCMYCFFLILRKPVLLSMVLWVLLISYPMELQCSWFRYFIHAIQRESKYNFLLLSFLSWFWEFSHCCE